MCDKTAYDPSPLLRQVFSEHVLRYGDPDMLYHFGEDGDPSVRLDVYVWQVKPDIPVTTFSTLGMSDRAMTGCEHRCELHWTIRDKMEDHEEADAAAFLANLATFPFLKGTYFDFWHVLPMLPTLPSFPSCSAGLFHPSFVDGGWDALSAGITTVKILNFVPLTAEECHEARTMGVNALLSRLQTERVDLFVDRTQQVRQPYVH